MNKCDQQKEIICFYVVIKYLCSTLNIVQYLEDILSMKDLRSFINTEGNIIIWSQW